MGNFESTFDEPVYFSDGTYVINGEFSAEEAAVMFSDCIGEDVRPNQIEKNRVRFGFPPEYVEDREDLGACWYTGAGTGHGTKSVWVYGK